MRKITNVEELKSIQLDILLALDEFCNERHIKYSLAAGSLIGAIRHKGFIPWDDDIDIYLLREDYKVLIESFPTIYKGYYSLVTTERDKKWHRAFGKLYDNRTLWVENSRNKYTGIGVSIDIFPIDDAPDNQSEWESYNKKRVFLRNVFMIKSLPISSRRSIIKNLLTLLSQGMLIPFSFSRISKWMNHYSQINNNKGYHHVYENCLGVYNSKTPWLKESFSKVIDAEFEGHQVKIMSGYDDYLKCVYGDYMQLPPEKKRITHHCFNAYWK